MTQTEQVASPWDDFFASPDRVPQDFMLHRDREPPQERDIFTERDDVRQDLRQ